MSLRVSAVGKGGKAISTEERNVVRREYDNKQVSKDNKNKIPNKSNEVMIYKDSIKNLCVYNLLKSFILVEILCRINMLRL